MIRERFHISYIVYAMYEDSRTTYSSSRINCFIVRSVCLGVDTAVVYVYSSNSGRCSIPITGE